MYWPMIPLLAGLIILGGCMLYTRTKRPADGTRFRGRGVIGLFAVIALILMIYSLIGFVTMSR